MAIEEDVAAIAGLRAAAAKHLTAVYGRGHWSSSPTEAAVRRALRSDRLLVALEGTRITGTVRLAAAKPWAIDPSYFTPVPRAVYLHDMAVDPASQRTGIGRRLVEEALGVARAWPSEAIRLDAYDSEAGAGPFYARCGFREVGRVVYRKTPLIYFERLL
jgi:GNAT superfamily N-acetyltransferase